MQRVKTSYAIGITLALSCLGLASLAHAVEVKFEPVASGVYAFVGEKGGRTHQNEGLNHNIGLVVTPTVPTLPTRWLNGSDETLNLGGMVVEVKHRNGAHTPGDVLVWLPQQRVVFSGDIVYVDRMPGVLPFSHAGHWLESFAALEALRPAHIVPGHGDVCDLPKAQAKTHDYLRALGTHMEKAVDDGAQISAAINSFDVKPWMGLLNAADLHPGNASRTYLELERE